MDTLFFFSTFFLQNTGARLSDAQVLQLQIPPEDGARAAKEMKESHADPSTIQREFAPYVIDGAPSFGPVLFGSEDRLVDALSSLNDDGGGGRSDDDDGRLGVVVEARSGTYLGCWDVIRCRPDGEKGRADWSYELNEEKESYEGGWLNGRRECEKDGVGIFSEARGGGVYVGGWHEDYEDGSGKRTYESRLLEELKEYDGMWRQGKWSGRGIAKYQNGTTVEAKEWGETTTAVEAKEWSSGGGGGGGHYGKGKGKEDGESDFLLEDAVVCFHCEDGTLESNYVGSVLYPFVPTGHFDMGERVHRTSEGNSSVIPFRHGQGVDVDARGNKYEGMFCRGKKHGVGKMLYRDGTVYNGDWRNDVWSGKGVLELWSRETYRGKFVGGKRRGYGVCMFANGKTYEGGWNNDVPEGIGKLEPHGIDRMEGEETYLGGWWKGQRHGEGVVMEGHHFRSVVGQEKSGGKVGEGGEGGEGEVGAVLVEYESGEVVRSEMVRSRREREEIVERLSRLLCVDKEEASGTSTPRGKSGIRPDYLKSFYRK